MSKVVSAMPKKIPIRQCLGCREHKPKGELIRVVRSPEGEISLDFRGKKPGRGAYLCLDAQCLKQARKSRRLERAFSCKIPEEVYQRLEEEIAQAERAAQEAQQPAGPLDEKGQPIIVIEEPEEPLPRRKGGGHG
mgnify:CR=1 FL=1